MAKVLLLILCIGALCTCDAYKILVVFSIPAKSHGILGEGIVRNLLKAGHEVTYIAQYPLNSTNPMLHEIDISKSLKLSEHINRILNLKNIMDRKILSMNFVQNFIWLPGNVISSQVLESENVQNFLKDKSKHFDAVIVEWLFNDLHTTISAVYEAPLIIFSSIEPHWMIISLIDETMNPAYNGYIVADKLPFTFLQRAHELCFTMVHTILRNTLGRFLNMRSYNKLVAPHIAARGRTPPPYVDILYNASLIIGNSHVSLGEAKTLPQSYISVGGYHIQEKMEPLPEDLKKIIENAKHGVIYFSMGSNLKSKDFPDTVKNEIINVFGSLKQTVIWKFEEKIPNIPSNVHILEWAPQQSILAHPNVLLFITHGGLLSITEAIYAGKPIIGIPVFADQFTTVARAVSRGFAKKVDLSYYNMAENLKAAIVDMLEDPKYTEIAKKLSFIYHDRPVKPGDEMVHWVEHVIKTGGAPHLRSPALMVPWYQKMYLDLAALIVVIVFALRYVYRFVKKIFFVKKTDSKKTN